MEIQTGYIDKKGSNYPNMRVIKYTRENIFGNLGKLVAETRREQSSFFQKSDFEIDEDGVYIYQEEDNDRALRVYKELFQPTLDSQNDVKLVDMLSKLQNKIKLTEFPLGIVTLDNRVIGQEIPYYEGYVPLIDIIETLDDKQLLSVYAKCLSIIKELNDNGVYYIDCHAKNFLVNPNFDVKLIDFEYHLVSVNDESAKKKQYDNLNMMIDLINSRIDGQLSKVNEDEEVTHGLRN